MTMKKITYLALIMLFVIILGACAKPAPFPLSEPGPYGVGMRKYSYTDAARNDREVSISVYYPAVQPSTPTSYGFTRDADPDPREAPYPLILSSTKIARSFAPYLVSHGFTWASVDKIDYYLKMNEMMIDQPLDILFALNQVASNPPEGLEGMIDAERAGVTGYSFDGYNALALSGTRINPQYYLAQCPTPDATTSSILSYLSAFDCVPAGAWDEFAAHAGEAITTSEDGLWQPMTDERIRAVIPMAGEGWWLFGANGLAAEDRPALMMTGSWDDLYRENVLIFEHLGTPDKTMITFINRDHGMISIPEVEPRMAHFMVAFFGYHLQGREDYAEYFSEDFVAQFDDLAWGVYQE
jgi:predicted dienelactone hydrolase